MKTTVEDTSVNVGERFSALVFCSLTLKDRLHLFKTALHPFGRDETVIYLPKNSRIMHPDVAQWKHPQQ